MQDGARTCCQAVTKLGELSEQACVVLPLFQQQVSTIVDSFEDLPPDKHGKPCVQVLFGALKHLYRCIEKTCLKAGEHRYECESVCDVVRCIIECDSVSLMERVLQALLSCPTMKVQRVKDRANELTSTVSPYLAWPLGSSPPHSSGKKGTISTIESLYVCNAHTGFF